MTTIQLQVPQSQIGEIKKIYDKKFDDLKNRFDLLYHEWEENEPIFKQLGILPDNLQSYSRLVNTFKKKNDEKPAINNGYINSWVWGDKAAFIFNRIDRELTIPELASILVKDYEPSLDKKAVSNSLNATLSVAAKAGKRFKRRITDQGEFLYQLLKKETVQEKTV